MDEMPLLLSCYEIEMALRQKGDSMDMLRFLSQRENGAEVHPGSMFENSHIPLHTWVHYIYRFTQGLRLRQVDMLQEGITWSSATLSKLADKLQRVCKSGMKRMRRRGKQTVGQRAEIVMIDESKFGHKRKPALATLTSFGMRMASKRQHESGAEKRKKKKLRDEACASLADLFKFYECCVCFVDPVLNVLACSSILMDNASKEMDTRTFYGRKKEQVRVIPSDSEDSKLEEDSEEEWTPESGWGEAGPLRPIMLRASKWSAAALQLVQLDGEVRVVMAA
ncbi:hypothetical protein ABVT39_007786 [Epinephelus coioides]